MDIKLVLFDLDGTLLPKNQDGMKWAGLEPSDFELTSSEEVIIFPVFPDIREG